MAKEKFVRSKPHVNVGTIGHIDHGKTTLTAAIVKVQSKKNLAKEIKYADIAKGGTVRDETKTVTIAAAHVEYESPARHYFLMEEKFLAFANNIEVRASLLDALMWRQMKDAGSMIFKLLR